MIDDNSLCHGPPCRSGLTHLRETRMNASCLAFRHILSVLNSISAQTTGASVEIHDGEDILISPGRVYQREENPSTKKRSFIAFSSDAHCPPSYNQKRSYPILSGYLSTQMTRALKLPWSNMGSIIRGCYNICGCELLIDHFSFLSYCTSLWMNMKSGCSLLTLSTTRTLTATRHAEEFYSFLWGCSQSGGYWLRESKWASIATNIYRPYHTELINSWHERKSDIYLYILDLIIFYYPFSRRYELVGYIQDYYLQLTISYRVHVLILIQARYFASELFYSILQYFLSLYKHTNLLLCNPAICCSQNLFCLSEDRFSIRKI